jgi:hypothetical protein
LQGLFEYYLKKEDVFSSNTKAAFNCNSQDFVAQKSNPDPMYNLLLFFIYDKTKRFTLLTSAKSEPFSLRFFLEKIL